MAGRPWRFYVYLLGTLDAAQYIGKGCGGRLVSQRSRYKLAGFELARFKRENDAFAAERKFIAELKPALNKSPGGGGKRAVKKIERAYVDRDPLMVYMRKFGTKDGARRVLSTFGKWSREQQIKYEQTVRISE